MWQVSKTTHSTWKHWKDHGRDLKWEGFFFIMTMPEFHYWEPNEITTSFRLRQTVVADQPKHTTTPQLQPPLHPGENHNRKYARNNTHTGAKSRNLSSPQKTSTNYETERLLNSWISCRAPVHILASSLQQNHPMIFHSKRYSIRIGKGRRFGIVQSQSF